MKATMNDQQIEAAIDQLVELATRPAEIEKNIAGYSVLLWWMLGEQDKWKPIVYVSKNGELVLIKGYEDAWDSDDVKLIPATARQKIDAYLQSQAPAVNAATQNKVSTGSNAISRLERIINSGVDVYITQLEDQYKIVVYNTKTKGKSAKDSVITQAAFDALQEYTLEDPDDPEGGESYAVNANEFFSPSNWTRLSIPVLDDVVSNMDVEQAIFITDHNGAEVFVVERD